MKQSRVSDYDCSRMRKIIIFTNVCGALLLNCIQTFSTIINRRQFYQISIILLALSIIFTAIATITSFNSRMIYNSQTIWGALNIFTVSYNLYLGIIYVMSFYTVISKTIIIINPTLILAITIIITIVKLKRYLSIDSSEEFNLNGRDKGILIFIGIATMFIVILIAKFLDNSTVVLFNYQFKKIIVYIFLTVLCSLMMVASGTSIGKRIFEFRYKVNLKKI